MKEGAKESEEDMALLTVVDEEASDGGRDGAENEPVARR